MRNPVIRARAGGVRLGMAKQINQGRWTAHIEGDFVVFLIGARFSKLHLLQSLKDLGGTKRGMQAMLNYLARLGWSHGDQEIFSADDLIREFDLTHIGKAGAVFDAAKLEAA